MTATLNLSKTCEFLEETLKSWLDSINDENKEYNITLNSFDVENITAEMIEKGKVHNWNVAFDITLQLPDNYFD